MDQFRAASPDVAIRTTFIVGFPGEADAQFDNLMRFVEKAQFDRAGVFEYSTEDGTPSADLPDRVPSRVKRARKDKLMRLQQGISLQRNRTWIGREIEVLVEEAGGSRRRGDQPSPLGEISSGSVIGRSFRDAPEIDGHVIISGSSAKPGDFARVTITDARPYDLIGMSNEV